MTAHLSLATIRYHINITYGAARRLLSLPSPMLYLDQSWERKWERGRKGEEEGGRGRKGKGGNRRGCKCAIIRTHLSPINIVLVIKNTPDRATVTSCVFYMNPQQLALFTTLLTQTHPPTLHLHLHLHLHLTS